MKYLTGTGSEALDPQDLIGGGGEVGQQQRFVVNLPSHTHTHKTTSQSDTPYFYV